MADDECNDDDKNNNYNIDDKKYNYNNNNNNNKITYNNSLSMGQSPLNACTYYFI